MYYLLIIKVFSDNIMFHLLSSTVAEFVTRYSVELNLASFLFGLLGVIVTFVSLFVGSNRKSLVYACKSKFQKPISTAALDESNPDVVADKTAKTTVAKVAIWNRGRDSIARSDISARDKLRIDISEGLKIIEYHILTRTRNSNGFIAKLDEDQKSIALDFDYLDHNDGVVLRIVHTGYSKNSLSLHGSIIAIKSFKKKNDSISYFLLPKTHLGHFFQILFLFVFGCIFVVTAVWGIFFIIADCLQNSFRVDSKKGFFISPYFLCFLWGFNCYQIAIASYDYPSQDFCRKSFGMKISSSLGVFCYIML